MENLEVIVAKIVDEANEKAKLILNDAKKQYDDILIKSDNKAQNAIKNLEKEYEVKEKTELERIKSATALKYRNIILQAKQEAIAYIFEELDKKIKNLSSDEMKAYINKSLGTRVLEANEKLIIPSTYEGIDLGREYVLSYKIKTGFLIEKNGIYENYTLEALIEHKKDEIEAKIQEKIFF